MIKKEDSSLKGESAAPNWELQDHSIKGKVSQNLIHYLLIFFCFYHPGYLCGSVVKMPPSLRKGDTIAIIAPASPEEDHQAVARAIKKILEKGFRAKVSPNLTTRYGYLAGTDAERVKAFMEAWLDPEVKAIWCYRGGFGCTRILDQLDYKAISSHPKILIGMSDVTALHAAINKESGLVTFLGPNVNAVFGKDEKSDNEYCGVRLWEMITTTSQRKVEGNTLPLPKLFPLKDQKMVTIRPGVGKGRLTGGTLSLITALIGTPWEIDTTGKILILEDVDEAPYRIDRMLRQLKQSGHLDHLSGAILCSWSGCQGKRRERTLSLEQVLTEYFEHAKYPVLLGFPSGHISDQATLPLNAFAELDASRKTLRLLENPVDVKK